MATKKKNKKVSSKKVAPKAGKKKTKPAAKKSTKKASASKTKSKDSTAKTKAAKKPVAKKTKAPVKKTKAVVWEKTKKITDQKPPVEQTKKERVKEPKVVIPNKAPAMVYPDANAVKERVKTILVSQPKPENEKSPYVELARKYNVKIDFRQFIKIEGVPAKDFRYQKINLTEHNAVILTSRNAVDHYFRMCNEMRYNVPETTKYFCLNEATAYYLQKYVQYRKRKIFYGQQSINDLVDQIKKNREEKFLLPVADVHREEKILGILDLLKINYTKGIFYRTVSADLSDFNGQLNYDVIVFFTPAGIKSLFQNFPNFKQGQTRIGAFGEATAQAVREHKLRLDIAAPNPQSPSMTMALENYIREVNKR